MQVNFVSEEAKTLYNNELKYATEGSSGFDLRAVSFDNSFDRLGSLHNIDKNWQEDSPPPITGYTLFSHGRILVKTGIKVKLPKPRTEDACIRQCELQIRSRSGLALKHGICVLNGIGTIDNDYNQEIGVILYNSSNEPFLIHEGDRVAQGVIVQVVKPLSFNYDDNIDDNERGGFGSTGIK